MCVAHLPQDGVRQADPDKDEPEVAQPARDDRPLVARDVPDDGMRTG